MFFSGKDHLFDQGHWQTRFAFDASVAAVFDDMALRSIPMYREVMQTLGYWAKAHAQPDTQIIDLGCSTGTSLIACMSQIPEHLGVVYRGIDNSDAMVAQARIKTRALFPDRPTIIEHSDIVTANLGRASVVILNYTLQFVPPSHRLLLLTRIFDCLLPGGILFLSEKLTIDDPAIHRLSTEEYYRFKEAQGYSKLAIERKRQALEQVLIPMSFTEEMNLLAKAGFTPIEVPVKWNQFCTFVGRRPQ